MAETPSPPVPSATGSLADRPLPNLLLFMHEKKLSGTLAFYSGQRAVAALHCTEGKPDKVQPIQTSFLEGVVSLFALEEDISFAYFEGLDIDGVASNPIDVMPVLWRGIRKGAVTKHIHALVERVRTSYIRLAAPTDRFGFGREETELLKMFETGSPLIEDFSATDLGKKVTYALLLSKSAVAEKNPSPPQAIPKPAPTGGVGLARLNLRSKQIAKPLEEPANVSNRDSRRTPFPPSMAGDDPLVAFRKEVEERAATIDNLDYFAILGIPRDAQQELIQTSYIQLAKKWHPDKLPAALADIKSLCAKVFSRVSEAHQTLSDAERRKNYMRLLTEGGASPKEQEKIQSVLEAASDFQKAEIFLKRGDYVEAEKAAKRAYDAVPDQADHLAIVAWINSLKTENPNELLNCIAELKKAIEMNPKSYRSYFYRGMVYKKLGNSELAYRDFKEVTELDPRNVDAQREVRLRNMRRDGKSGSREFGAVSGPKSSGKMNATKAPDAPTGVLGKLFKR